MQKRTQKDQDKIKLVLTQTVILSGGQPKFGELARELVEFRTFNIIKTSHVGGLIFGLN